MNWFTFMPFRTQVPKLHSIEDTERYLAVVNQFVFVGCDCVVTMHGITLSPLALVMEYLPLGPLDVYLREHNDALKEVSYCYCSSGCMIEQPRAPEEGHNSDRVFLQVPHLV